MRVANTFLAKFWLLPPPAAAPPAAIFGPARACRRPQACRACPAFAPAFENLNLLPLTLSVYPK